MIDLAAVRLTRQKVNAGIWICAGLTMVASAISGVTAFYYLQRDGWGIASGAMTAFAVDVALWVVLTGDRLMEAIGITAGPWARAVRWGTAGMSVMLNVTAAAVANIPSGAKVPLIILHAFVPLVMVALAELRGEYARSLAPKEQEALELEEQRQKVLDTPIVTPSERTYEENRGLASQLPPITPLGIGTPAAVDDSSFLPQASTTPALTAPAFPPPRAVVTPLRSAPSRPKPRQPAASSTPVKDRIIAHLDKHHRSSPLGITADELARKLKANQHTCKKVLAEWRRGLAKEAS